MVVDEDLNGDAAEINFLKSANELLARWRVKDRELEEYAKKIRDRKSIDLS